MRRAILVSAAMFVFILTALPQISQSVCGGEYYCALTNLKGEVSEIRVSDRSARKAKPYWFKAATWCIEWDRAVVTIRVHGSELNQKTIRITAKPTVSPDGTRSTWLPVMIEKDPDSAMKLGVMDINVKFLLGDREKGGWSSSYPIVE